MIRQLHGCGLEMGVGFKYVLKSKVTLYRCLGERRGQKSATCAYLCKMGKWFPRQNVCYKGTQGVIMQRKAQNDTSGSQTI